MNYSESKKVYVSVESLVNINITAFNYRYTKVCILVVSNLQSLIVEKLKGAIEIYYNYYYYRYISFYYFYFYLPM